MLVFYITQYCAKQFPRKQLHYMLYNFWLYNLRLRHNLWYWRNFSDSRNFHNKLLSIIRCWSKTADQKWPTSARTSTVWRSLSEDLWPLPYSHKSRTKLDMDDYPVMTVMKISVTIHNGRTYLWFNYSKSLE